MAEALSQGAGLSGHMVRGLVEDPGQPSAVAHADLHSLEETVRHAGEYMAQALNMVGQAMGEAVDVVSDKAFQAAANTGMPAGTGLETSTFSWSGYIQALGIMCLLLAGLWFAVWALRRYGRFNFIPRPGSLPRESLMMEAQMPLGPRKGLMVVRFMGRRLLLGVTDHRITLLAEDTSMGVGRHEEEEDGDDASAEHFRAELASRLSGVQHADSRPSTLRMS